MPDPHTLEETERVTSERLAHLNLDFDAALGVLSIHRAANATRAYMTNKVLRPKDLTWSGFLVLWLLWIWQSMETRYVAESVGISKATLTGVSNTLVSRGWIRRVRSKTDRRLVSLELTPAGAAMLDELFPAINALEHEVVRDLEAAQLQTMTESLRVVVKTVEAMTATDDSQGRVSAKSSPA